MVRVKSADIRGRRIQSGSRTAGTRSISNSLWFRDLKGTETDCLKSRIHGLADAVAIGFAQLNGLWLSGGVVLQQVAPGAGGTGDGIDTGLGRGFELC